jgi:hypothetical protein
MTARW